MIELAISIRQPYVEQIFRSIKKKSTGAVRPRFGAASTCMQVSAMAISTDFSSLGAEPGDFPTGVIVGSVEITGCRYNEPKQCYAYRLANPQRLRKPIPPRTILSQSGSGHSNVTRLHTTENPRTTGFNRSAAA